MTPGDRAWLGLLAYIVTYDAYALFRRRETLSQSFDRALRDPRRNVLTIAVWAGVTVHLFDKQIRRILDR